jgi:hypothetical protein
MKLLISSKDRQAGESTHDFSVRFNPTLFEGKQWKYQVEQILLPRFFYPINSNNNTLDFKDSGGNIGQVVLTPGEYSYATFATALKAALEAAATAVDTYTVSVDTTTFLITISTGGNFELTLSTSTMNDVLGFGTTNLTGAATYTASKIFKLDGDDVVLVQSNIGQELINTNGRYRVLQTMVNDKNFGEFLTIQQMNVSNFIDVLPDDLSNIRIKVTDQSGTLLDLNGQEINIILQLA